MEDPREHKELNETVGNYREIGSLILSKQLAFPLRVYQMLPYHSAASFGCFEVL